MLKISMRFLLYFIAVASLSRAVFLCFPYFYLSARKC